LIVHVLRAHAGVQGSASLLAFSRKINTDSKDTKLQALERTLKENRKGWPMISNKDIERLAQELAEHAGLTVPEAMRVLQVLHVDKVCENADALHKVLSNDVTSRALNISEAARIELLHAASPQGFTLQNLRVGVRPTGAFHVQLMV
jgi:hypothetical protein